MLDCFLEPDELDIEMDDLDDGDEQRLARIEECIEANHKLHTTNEDGWCKTVCTECGLHHGSFRITPENLGEAIFLMAKNSIPQE